MHFTTRLYVEQVREGDRYHELVPAIVICVLDKPLFKEIPHLHSDFRLRDESGNVLTDDLQVHLLELTKLAVTRENLLKATVEQQWAYFLLNADKLTMEEIRELFPESEFVEAAGVLEVIKNTPEQMDHYISRLKYQLDEVSRLESTRLEALQEGEKRGELIGRIKTFQELLGVTEPGNDQLSEFDFGQLAELCEQLRIQLHGRHPN